MNHHNKAIFALFLSTVLWGSAGVIMKLSLNSIGPYYLLAFRFATAALILLLLFRKRIPKISWRTWKIGSFMGVLLYFEFLFFTIGLKYTTASKSGFILGAYVILVPVVYFIVNRKSPAKSSMLASFVCLIGVALVVLDDWSGINIGDLIVSISSACYAIHVVLTAKVVKNQDPIEINIVQISIAALIAIGIAPFMENFPAKITDTNVISISYLAVAATICPYLLSVYGQKYTKTTTAAVILSFECVIGCIAAVLVLHDPLTFRVVLGATIMVSSFLITEVGVFNKGQQKAHV